MRLAVRTVVHHVTPLAQEDAAMKKLHLDADELKVESFPTAHADDEYGTVRAHVGTLAPPSCPAPVCHTYDDTVCGLSRGCAE
jgi:hypothetical protein